MKAKWIVVVMGVLLTSGCIQTLKQGASAGLSVGSLAAPEYAGVLGQIQRVINKEEPSPVEGFEFDIVYRYRGQIVDPEDITWEERFIRQGSADQGMPPVGAAASGSIDEPPEDAQLRAEISAILKAAGVGEEE